MHEVHRTSLRPDRNISVDLHDFAGKFQTEAVTGSAFLALSHAEMKEELGLSQFGVRKKLMLKIEALRDFASDNGCKPLGGPGRNVRDAPRLERAGDLRISTAVPLLRLLVMKSECCLGLEFA